MTIPRFKLRTLVVLIAFMALVLTILTLTIENRRLRAEAQATRAQMLYRLLVEQTDARLVDAYRSPVKPATGTGSKLPK